MSLLIVLTFAYAWAYVPRGATTADLARDLAAGEVVRVDPNPPSGQRLGPTATIDVGRTFIAQIRWKTSDGRVYQAPSAWLLGRPGQVDLARTVTATAEAAGHPEPTVGPIGAGWAGRISDDAPMMLWLLLVVLLVLSPPTRRMTKWAVFWLLLTAGGLGALVWVWWDAPWSPSANRLPDWRTGERASATAEGTPTRWRLLRRPMKGPVRGWVTLLVALVVNAAVSALLVTTFAHLYTHPGGSGPVEWSIIDKSGLESTWVQP